MRRILFSLISVFAFFIVLGGDLAAATSSGDPNKIRMNPEYELSGPYAHQNLSIFFIHGVAEAAPKSMVPLADALEGGMVTIKESGNVERLFATNHSNSDYVFIQSGDIVKGGRQDRTLTRDVILAPKAKNVALNSYCVEKGRWQKRGKEKVDRFSSSNKRLSSKKLKLAAKKAKSQEAVWQAVHEEQEKLGRVVAKSVRKPASATSLQLSLEDKDVEDKLQDYMTALIRIGQRQDRAVGFAFAINGQFNSADIYGDPTLFQKLWPKLIETAACEALSLNNRKKAHTPAPTKDEVGMHVIEALKSRMQKEPSSALTRRAAAETQHTHAFETKDEKDRLVHINIIKK